MGMLVKSSGRMMCRPGSAGEGGMRMYLVGVSGFSLSEYLALQHNLLETAYDVTCDCIENGATMHAPSHRLLTITDNAPWWSLNRYITLVLMSWTE